MEFNVAMLAKQAWRLINKASPLVTDIMKARYYPSTDFLKAEMGRNPSYMWRSILASQEAIRQGCRRKIGDGRDTNIWDSPWLPCEVNGYMSSPLYPELEDSTVNGLITEDRNSWDLDIIRDLCNERDGRLIQQIPLPASRRKDSWYWLPDGKGEFTVRSCYRKLRGESGGQDDGFWKRMWSLQLPGKVLNFLWRACHNVLPTMTELARKQVEVNMMCGWCNVYVEEAIHTLFTCSFARELWAEEGLQGLSDVAAGMTVKDVLKKEFTNGNRVKWAKIGVLCWGLWTRRNTWIWDRNPMSVFGVRSMAMCLLQDWQRSQESTGKGSKGLQQRDRKWCRPPEGWIKINLDAACQTQTGEVGVACVIRDDRGNFLRARSNRIHGNMQARDAEARSLKEALIWTHNWRKQRCIFETDSKLVVDAIYGDRGNSLFHIIIDDCVELLKHFEEALVVFEYRSANTVAHLLARAAFSMSGLMEWLQTAPDLIHCNLISEAI